MADKRINDPTRPIATEPASDDYFVIDGNTNNVRRLGAEYLISLDPSFFEVGGIDVDEAKYTDINYRVRSSVGYTIDLKSGDKIICIDPTNCYFWVNATNSIGTVTYTITPVTTYTAAEDVSVILLLGFRNTDPITNYKELVRKFVIVGKSRPLDYVSNLIKKESLVSNNLPKEAFIEGLSINVSTGTFSKNVSAAVLSLSISLDAESFLRFDLGVHHKFGVWFIYDDGSSPSGLTLRNGFIYISKKCSCIVEFYVDSGYTLDIDAIASNFKVYTKEAWNGKFLTQFANALKGNIQSLDSSTFHFGYSGVSDGVYTAIYGGEFYNLITDYLSFVELKAHDVIRIKDSAYKVRVVIVGPSGTPSQSSYFDSIYIVPNDCSAWICISRVDNSLMTQDELIYAPSCVEIFSVYPKRNAEIIAAISVARRRREILTSSQAKIRLAAHRGSTGLAPENTIPAFLAAKMNGYDYIETDVQFTSDGVPVILHDETVDRTSNGTGKLYEMTYAQVLALDFGSWFSDGRFAGTKIPTLEEVCLLAKRIGLGIYLEFKPFGDNTFDDAQIEQIIGIVEKYGMMDNVMFTGGRHENVHRLRPNAGVVLGGNAITQSNIVSQALAVKGNNRVEVWGQVNDTFDSDVVSELLKNDIHIGAWTAAAQNTVPVIRAVPHCVDTFVTNSVDVKSLFSSMALFGWN